MNNKNLKPWPSGVSGNPKGRKKGSKNLSTIVNELLDLKVDSKLLRGDSKIIIENGTTYAKAITLVMLTKAVNGDISAANWVANHNIGFDNELDGFFLTSKLEIEIVK